MPQQDQSDSYRDYYKRRESQERAAAERADDPIARRVHLELARGYAARACLERLDPTQPVA